MTSLRTRLIAGIAAFIVAFGVCAGVFSFRWAFDEAIEFQDAILIQVASLTASQAHHQIDTPPGIVDNEARIYVQELSGGSGLLPENLAEGLHTTSANGEPWRVAVRKRDDGSRVAVAQPTSAREEIARYSAIRTLIPLAGLLPCLMLVVAGAIHLAFRPLSVLSDRLDASNIDHMQKLETRAVSRELQPFVLSINRLLERLEVVFQQQKKFIADASHELRSPITALSLQAQNIDSDGLPADQRIRLNDLKLGVARIARLLDQLLTSARFGSRRSDGREITALDVSVIGVVAELMPQADAGDVDLGFQKIEPVMVKAGALAVAVLARNLLENALRHTPRQGRVDVSIIVAGGRAIFRVEDSGSGIAADELPRVFEPFYRGANASAFGDGNGLGLSIVRQIVDSCGAEISLANGDVDGKSGLRVEVVFEAESAQAARR